MVKKSDRNAIIVVVVIAIILFFVLGGGDIFPFAVVSPTPGFQFIINPSDPLSPYSEIIEGTSFTCDADENNAP